MKYHHSNTILNYEITGDGKPVIILHGLCCSMEMMKACLEPVFQKENHYRRIYIDLPGMGKSTGETEHASADGILDILLDFIENVVHEKYLLVGESYGGYLARGILSRDAKHVDGLMLLCPVVEPERSKRILPENIIRFEDACFLDTLAPEDKEGFSEYAILANEHTYQRYHAEILPALKSADEKYITKLEKNYSFSFDADGIIGGLGFDKPTLFISGKQDNCVGYEDLWRLVKDYSRASFFILDAAGHNLQIEQDILFSQMVENWLFRIEQEK
jgi:pimeloyl-ACP methyl ester carboxylesterase